MIYPLSAIRALALHTQALTTPNGDEPDAGRDMLDRIGRQIAVVQIDTLHVVQRAQYLTLWSRLGSYDPAAFDALSYDPNDRRWFEGWFHAACYMPLEDYRYHRARMQGFQDNMSAGTRRWLADGGADLMQQVLQRVREEGALRVSDFESDGKKRGSWWDWKPAKIALEMLYRGGDLMVSNRVNFQRVYDLRERVLPDWVDTSQPTPEAIMRHTLESLVKAAGASQPGKSMGRMFGKNREAQQMTAALIREGVLVEIQAEMTDGQAHTLLVHRDNLPLLQQAADGAIQPRRTTFLNFFDNLFWEYGRDELFWNYRHILEAYIPAPKREWGYFCMDILHGDQVVGRFDPKVDRKTGTMILKALVLEPGVQPGEKLVADVAAAMRDFMAFHKATELVIEKSAPADFGDKLLRAV